MPRLIRCAILASLLVLTTAGLGLAQVQQPTRPGLQTRPNPAPTAPKATTQARPTTLSPTSGLKSNTAGTKAPTVINTAGKAVNPAKPAPPVSFMVRPQAGGVPLSISEAVTHGNSLQGFSANGSSLSISNTAAHGGISASNFANAYPNSFLPNNNNHHRVQPVVVGPVWPGVLVGTPYVIGFYPGSPYYGNGYPTGPYVNPMYPSVSGSVYLDPGLIGGIQKPLLPGLGAQSTALPGVSNKFAMPIAGLQQSNYPPPTPALAPPPAPPPEPSPEPAPAPPPPSVDGPATLTVQVPNADTQVWLEDTLMKQQGTSRTFKTPALQSGKYFAYMIRARWMEDGEEINREVEVIVRAGLEMTVNFIPASEDEK